MKQFLLIFAILLFAGLVKGQTVCTVPSGFVCITQTAADSIAKDLDELKASRVALAKATAQVALTDAERAAAKSVIDAMQAAFDARGKIVADQTAMIELQQKVIAMYSQLVEKLTAQINKPKTGFQKLLAVLVRIADIATGIAIGRVL